TTLEERNNRGALAYACGPMAATAPHAQGHPPVGRPSCRSERIGLVVGDYSTPRPWRRLTWVRPCQGHIVREPSRDHCHVCQNRGVSAALALGARAATAPRSAGSGAPPCLRVPLPGFGLREKWGRPPIRRCNYGHPTH